GSDGVVVGAVLWAVVVPADDHVRERQAVVRVPALRVAGEAVRCVALQVPGAGPGAGVVRDVEPVAVDLAAEHVPRVPTILGDGADGSGERLVQPAGEPDVRR